jgi:O-antigen ligase
VAEIIRRSRQTEYSADVSDLSRYRNSLKIRMSNIPSQISRPMLGAGVAVPRPGLLVYARGLTITVYFLSLLIGLWWFTDWQTMMEIFESGYDRKAYFYYGFAIAVLGHLTLGPGAWFSAPFAILSTWEGRLITAFCALMLLLAPTSVVPRQSATYAMATAVVVVLMWLFWYSNYYALEKVLTFTGFAIFGWLLILLLHHGLTRGIGGELGSVNRNITGTAALAAMVCGMFSPKNSIRWTSFFCGLFFIVIVSSRGSMVALAVFLAVYYLLHKGTLNAFALGGGVVLLALFTFLISPGVREFVIETIFRVHDSRRGVGSGFTGRVEMWETAINAFWQRPLTGWGFRSASGEASAVGGVHSGWLKIFAESGIFGGILMISTVALVIIRRFFLAWNIRTLAPAQAPGMDLPETVHINALTCASFCMLATMWVYDQYYINLGSPVSLLFFLMLAAPVYITSQGIALYRWNPQHALQRSPV